jgi:hypothetical protein
MIQTFYDTTFDICIKYSLHHTSFFGLENEIIRAHSIRPGSPLRLQEFNDCDNLLPSATSITRGPLVDVENGIVSSCGPSRMLHAFSAFLRAMRELLQYNPFRSVILVDSRNRSLDPGLKVTQIVIDLLQVGTTRSPLQSHRSSPSVFCRQGGSGSLRWSASYVQPYVHRPTSTASLNRVSLGYCDYIV